MSAEHIVARADELKDGQMKEIRIDQQSVLLVRIRGQYRAFGSTCPHHGAPLAEGVLCDGHIRCPWHQAIFDADTGDLMEPPALDCLPQLPVRLDGQDVLVTVPETIPPAREPQMARYDPSADGRTFVIIGAGAAGLTAAETLRQAGYQGRVIMLTREAHPPYDRTDLSKAYLRKPEPASPFLRSPEFYQRHGIEVLTGQEVTCADAEAKTVSCRDGLTVRYDRLLLASGAQPRRLEVRGAELENVFLLRSLDDCRRIRDALPGASRAVVVGASFIGMEVSAALTGRGLSVTIVSPESAPFQWVFGPDIGRMYQKVHREKGVTFRLGSRAERFEGRDGRLQAAVLDDGHRIAADLAVIGIGVRPVTGFLKGIAVRDDSSVPVDACLRAGPDVWAAGDIASFPDWRSGEPIRIEHWRLAQQHGRIAAMNMAGRAEEFRAVPFFWTNQFGVITEYVGFAREWDRIEFDGSTEDRKFVAYYMKGPNVIAAAGCDESRRMALIAELMRAFKTPTLEQIRKESAEVEHLLRV